MKKVIKVIVIIGYLVMAIELFGFFLDNIAHSDAMGINFICSLPILPMSIFLVVLSIISLNDFIHNSFRITILDKILLIIFLINCVNVFVVMLLFLL